MKILQILIVLLGISCQLNGQSIIEVIEKSLVKNAIFFEEVELGFERNIEVKSERDRYFVFNTKLKSQDSILIFNPRKYYIFDRAKDKIHELEIEERFENFYRYKFAKFYDSKLILVYKEIMETNYHLDEFNISGNKISSKNGICPALKACKCYNLKSNYIVWIEYGGDGNMNLLNLKTNETTKLAKLNLTLSADGNFFGSPKIELDHLNRRVLITNFMNAKEKTNIVNIERKGFIKPIAKYEIEENTMMFYY